MAASFVAIVLAFIMMAAPLSAEACEATCATREAQSATPHSCHQHAVTQPGTAIIAIHLCGHDDGAPTVVERVTPPVALAATAVVVFEVPEVARGSVAASAVDFSPPTHLNLISQLRI